MGDLALTWGDGNADLTLFEDDLASDGGLRTAVLLSLFADRRAEDGDVLPTADGNLRGWWGDEFAETTTDRIGSRLWLLDRSKHLTDTTPRAEQYDREALQWMMDDRVAERIDITVFMNRSMMVHDIVIYRPDGRDPTSFRFAHVWDAEIA